MKKTTEKTATDLVKTPDGASKRAKVVIEHINKHGFVTTEDLKETYGYSHPPRAARDVRDAGIELETFQSLDTQGKKIAAYRFVKGSNAGAVKGRRAIPKAIKDKLVLDNNGRCIACHTEFDSRYLQVDHKIPLLIAGELKGELKPKDFQLLCASCNRAKSWSCEHCPNLTKKSAAKCRTCFWHNPSAYDHIATEEIKRVTITWQGKETSIHSSLLDSAKKQDLQLQVYIKSLLSKAVDPKPKTN